MLEMKKQKARKGRLILPEFPSSKCGSRIAQKRTKGVHYTWRVGARLVPGRGQGCKGEARKSQPPPHERWCSCIWRFPALRTSTQSAHKCAGCAKAEEENKNLSLQIQSGILGKSKEEQETKMPQKAQEICLDFIHQKKRYGCWWECLARPISFHSRG